MALWSARLWSVFVVLALFTHDLGVTGQLGVDFSLFQETEMFLIAALLLLEHTVGK